MAYTDSSYALVQGRVFLAERARNGALTTGLDWIGDADSVQLTVSQKTQPVKDQFSGGGLTTANPVIETSVSVKINALDTRLANWAAATWGDSSGARTSGSVSGEAITLYNGRYAKLVRIGVSSVVVTGAVLNTDYVVDSAAHGMLRVLASSVTIPSGTPLTTTVAYNYAASTGKVEALVLGQKYYQIVVAGINVAQANQPTVLTIRQVQLQMASKIDALGKKSTSLELSGELIVDSTIAAPSVHGDTSQYFSFEKA